MVFNRDTLGDLLQLADTLGLPPAGARIDLRDQMLVTFYPAPVDPALEDFRITQLQETGACMVFNQDTLLDLALIGDQVGMNAEDLRVDLRSQVLRYTAPAASAAAA